MVCRVLTRDLNARPSPEGGHAIGGVPATTAEAIDRLLTRAGGPAGHRPSATEWRQALQGRAVQQVSTVPRPAPEPAYVWPHRTASSVPTQPGVRRWRAVAEPVASEGAGGLGGGVRPADPAPAKPPENWLRRLLRKARE